MGNPVKQIVISGYYGFRNSGDEAVLQSILLALEAEGEKAGVTIEPIVLSVDPDLTSQMYGVKAVHRMKPRQIWQAIRGSDGLISGGGSLLQDTTGWKTIPYYLGVIRLAQWLGKPTFIYSQGLGPVKKTAFYNPIASIFSRSRYVSVRDKESADLLRRMGYTKDVEVVPDPVMGLPLREPSAGGAVHENVLSAVDGAGGRKSDRPAVIGVSVRYWTKDRSELRGIAESLKQIIGQCGEVEIRLLPFHLPADEQASRDVLTELEGAASPDVVLKLVQGVEHPQEMLREVASCDLLIGMRLHSLIYAASQQVPMVAVSYDPKIDQFMRRLDSSSATTADSYEPEAVTEAAMRLLQASPEWHSARRMRIAALKKEARRPAQQIAALLRQ
ncbi:MAG: csaB [Paenibacillaceae bacterium]|nr:csaB [Paenibacillaceae bacterium]